MTRNPNDSSLQAQIDELRELLRANPLRSMSVEQGRTRFYAGSELLIEDSNLTVVGEAFITGLLRVVGRIAVEGLGILDVNGLINLMGAMRVLSGGGITVEGGGNIVVNGGEIRVGNVLLKDGQIIVGTGTAQVIIDGATGRITAGNVTLDPTVSGGALTYANGAQVFTDAQTIQLFKGNSVVQVSNDYAKLQHGGDVVELDNDGLRISLGALDSASSTDGLQWLAVETASGRIKRVAPGIGGPGGSLEWPFPPSMVTSEYGPRPVTIDGASSFHEGIDFGAAPGAPIPAAGSGTVTTAGMSGGFGNLVIINHGGGIETYYAHMQTTPYVTVGQVVPRGHILGPVGKTGISGEEHLHFEVHVNGSPVNPRSKLPAA